MFFFFCSSVVSVASSLARLAMALSASSAACPWRAGPCNELLLRHRLSGELLHHLPVVLLDPAAAERFGDGMQLLSFWSRLSYSLRAPWGCTCSDLDGGVSSLFSSGRTASLAISGTGVPASVWTRFSALGHGNHIGHLDQGSHTWRV